MNKKTFAILAVLILAILNFNLAFAEELPPSVTGDDSSATTTETTPELGSEPSSTEVGPTESSTEDTGVKATEMVETSTEATTEATSTTEEANDTKAFKDFDDVSVEHPYYNAIIILRYQGLLQGYDDNTFRPEQPLNRVEALKLVFEVAKIEMTNGIAAASFTDTEEMSWYSGYLNKAVYLEIVNGYADGSFKPSQSVNLVEFLKMLLLAQKADVADAVLAQIPYADVMPGQWYSKYVNYAKIKDLLKADESNRIFPGQPLTRGRAADIIYRFKNLKSLDIETSSTTTKNSGSTSDDSSIIPVKDFALYVSNGWGFAIQYPKYWFYSSFIEKVDPTDIAAYGFGPDDLSTNDPLVTLELLPNNENYSANLIYNGFSYAQEASTDGKVHLITKIEGSSRIYRIIGPEAQKENMLNMLSSLTADIEGLESNNPAAVEEATETSETTTEVTEETETTTETTETTSELPPETP